MYSNASKLLGALKVAKAKGTLEVELKKIERCLLLILDDAILDCIVHTAHQIELSGESIRKVNASKANKKTGIKMTPSARTLRGQ